MRNNRKYPLLKNKWESAQWGSNLDPCDPLHVRVVRDSNFNRILNMFILLTVRGRCFSTCEMNTKTYVIKISFYAI